VKSPRNADRPQSPTIYKGKLETVRKMNAKEEEKYNKLSA
jgi:hypothetical protein